MLLPRAAGKMLADYRIKRGALPGGMSSIVFKKRTEQIAQRLQPDIPRISAHEGGQNLYNKAPVGRMLELKFAQHEFKRFGFSLKAPDERKEAFLVQEDMP